MQTTPTMEQLVLGCESEKLHLSGAIQPFGALIGVHDGQITHVSANCAAFLGQTPESLLERSLLDALPEFVPLLETFSLDEKPFHYAALRLSERRVEVKLSRSGGGFIFDIEEYQQEHFTPRQFENLDIFFAPQHENDLQHYFNQYVTHIAHLCGYDRVLLYQFQEDFSGKVITESARSTMGSYMNLRFPASDIPKIARDLYMLNPSRTICDTQVEPIGIISKRDQSLDLTYSDTRSVSPIHIEYLTHMGVRASFSIPIIIGNELWGLLAAHHLVPRHLGSSNRHRCVKLTKTFELGLRNFFALHKMRYYDEIEFVIGALIKSIDKEHDPHTSLVANGDAILKLVDADGFIYCDRQQAYAIGNTPDATAFKQLDTYFLTQYEAPLLHSNALVHDRFISGHYLGPLGVLAAKVFQGGEYKRCYWFRDETIEAYAWAGNPNKPVIEDAGALMLSPRRSFEKWIEERRGYAKSFNSFEHSSAMKFLRQLSRLI